MWHEHVIRDPLLTPTAWRYAGLVMHDYYINRNGYSAISARNAAKMLKVSPAAIQNARNALVARGWLKHLEDTGHQTARYEIAFANVDFIARDMRFKELPEVVWLYTLPYTGVCNGRCTGVCNRREHSLIQVLQVLQSQTRGLFREEALLGREVYSRVRVKLKMEGERPASEAHERKCSLLPQLFG
jgi:hypothetical protein